ncbi:MAG: GTP-binding protein, partial [Bacteroidota bacterium]
MLLRLILVGGFLGSGKTTLLWETAQRLAKRGLKAGLITNDQAPELVDTAFLSRDGVKVAEVNG